MSQMFTGPDPDGARITAVLGPTNTGKTYLAIERMLGHATGMIGFPLRLLARENYDRIVRLKGKGAVALITGEERIIPAHPRWFVCTVESMPVNRMVDFLAIDEVQLAADPDRGHVFTDRLLHARGRQETMFLGAETIKPLLRDLIPEAEFVTRERFSTLSYVGPKKLTRLPRRSAVVAFSAADVYSIAELVRRTRGGTAVVLGALSPRTRNAQVAMFQAGEVEHLVATDAIGMGLNMDIDHVSFASLRKFDGRVPRDLTAAEIGQIAGRAGRGMADGTFGTTADSGQLDPEVIERVENHEFPALRGLFWRNRDLRFTSIDALLTSLAKGTDRPGLLRPRPADDQQVLEALAREEDIRQTADRPERVRLLWEVCQIPDFRKVMPETHARLLAQIYRHLTAPGRRLPTDWVAAHLDQLDRTDGDMHALMDRIASIRVWTYISHRADWLPDSLHWQERARAVEDMLSDALHDRLTQRFVDVRTSVLAKRLRDGQPLLAAVKADDSVIVEGHHIGHLDGLTFLPEKGDTRTADRAVLNAAGKALRGEIARRVEALAQDGDDAFALDDDSRLTWRGAVAGRLTAGPDILRPRVEVPGDEFLDGDARDTIRQRLADWLAGYVARTLPPLSSPPPDDLGGAGRGVLFQVAEGLGSLPAATARDQVKALTEKDRKILARLGLRFGTESIFAPKLLKPHAQRLRAQLWAADAAAPLHAVPEGLMSLDAAPEAPAAFYAAIGYRVFAGRAVRIDVLERFAAEVRRLLRDKVAGGSHGPLPPATLSLIGVTAEQGLHVLQALGYDAALDGEGAIAFAPRPRRKRPTPGTRAQASAKTRSQDGAKTPPHRPADPAKPPPAKRQPPRQPPRPAPRAKPVDPDSPFAVLATHAVLRQPEPKPKAKPRPKPKPKTQTPAPKEAAQADAPRPDAAPTRKRRRRGKGKGQPPASRPKADTPA